MERPSVDQWLEEAKKETGASETGMYLVHNGIVRERTKASARGGIEDGKKVVGMDLSVDHSLAEKAIEDAKAMPGITLVRVWINEGHLVTGDDIMLVLVGGNIRPNVVNAFQALVETLKTKCIMEKETF